MYPNQAKKQNSFSDPLPLDTLFPSASLDSQILLPVSLPSPTASWLPSTQPPLAVLTQATGGRWLLIKSSGFFFFFLDQTWSASEPVGRGPVCLPRPSLTHPPPPCLMLPGSSPSSSPFYLCVTLHCRFIPLQSEPAT